MLLLIFFRKNMNKHLVIKFGGSSLESIDDFKNVSQIIKDMMSSYANICVVVSAMKGMTDKLENLAQKVGIDPPKRETDMLLSVGERISMALLAMTLANHGIEAVSLTGSQAGIITSTEHNNAKILDVHLKKISTALQTNKIPIIAGFQGMSIAGEITTLGRGGSDTTAVAIAAALSAKVIFYKDVNGVYSKDPNLHRDAILYNELSYQEALEVVGEGKSAVLHPRSIILARDNNLVLEIRSFTKGLHDKIGSKVYSIYEESKQKKITYERVS